jgi:hypothetical protein
MTFAPHYVHVSERMQHMLVAQDNLARVQNLADARDQQEKELRGVINQLQVLFK